jgi:hypothetical protein
MGTRLRRRIRFRKRRGVWSKISKDLVHRRWFKWAVIFAAFALSQSLHNGHGAGSAFADVFQNPIPEPSSISLLVGGAALLWLQHKRKN